MARDACARMAVDPKLIGYSCIDCPTWVHTLPQNEWRGPLFDPQKLASATERRQLRELASRSYKVAHEAVRRYDRHHLILGDRYEARAPLPEEVVEAALPYVDVLSFQDFSPPVEIASHLKRWHDFSPKPVLWADGAAGIPQKDGQRRNGGAHYAEVLKRLRDIPGVIGAHLCGAYLRNRFRRRGLTDEQERPDEEMVRLIAAADRETAAWAEQFP